MLSQPQWGGDGITVRCQLQVSDSCLQTLTFATVEADRKVPGGPYRRDNIQPACPPCNKVKSNHWITP